MSYFFAIILILILIWMFFGDRIRRWLQRRMMEKFEDAIRTRMGMPSAKEERRQRKAADRQAHHSSSYGQRQKGGAYYHPGPNAGARSSQSVGDTIIPREYAEDVEYVEYKEYSASATVIAEDDPSTGRKTSRVITESQVSDVEYVEIKSKSK
ncbi:MAG: hypothetical protein K2M31_02105 [Muribaculaceae bacterium]|nr:hypothetical protein [Muribaculaceae bacterium]